jgi:hypothetical protein
MGALLSRLISLIAYACVGTFIAEAAGIAYLRATGKLDDQKIERFVEVAQGLDKNEAKTDEPLTITSDYEDQPSYEEREQARDLQARQLEMREQALKSGLDRVRFEQRNLTVARERYDSLQGAFDQQLESLRSKALSSGLENVRQIWENIKPKQAKEQILEMIEAQEVNDVVSILSAMPIGKRAKIVAEFKSPEEAEKLEEILRLIRQGVPEVNLIDKTRSQIKQP